MRGDVVLKRGCINEVEIYKLGCFECFDYTSKSEGILGVILSNRLVIRYSRELKDLDCASEILRLACSTG